MRFTLTIPDEPPRTYATRREALAYVARRQNRGALPEGATITDTKTGTVLEVKPPLTSKNVANKIANEIDR